MSLKKDFFEKLAREVGDLSDDAIRALRQVLPKNATIDEGKQALDRIMRAAPVEIDFAAKPTRRAAPQKSLAAKTRAPAKQKPAGRPAKYQPVEPVAEPHPELADVQFPQGSGLGGPFAIANRVPLVGRRPFLAQSPSGYSGLAGSTPANRVVADVQQINPLAERRIVWPEEIARRFKAGIPFVGDKLRTGVGIRSVNERPQVGTALAFGGGDYPRMKQAMGQRLVWGSGRPVVSGIRGLAREAQDLYGGPVAGVFTAMGPGGLDQSTAMIDLLARQLQAGGVRKADLGVLDERVKALLGRDLAGEFVGFSKDPMSAGSFLNDIRRIDMPTRSAVIQSLDTADALRAGFPDIGANRAALTTPELLYAPEGTSGLTISAIDPEWAADKTIRVPANHPNYPEGVVGEYFGSYPTGAPRELFWSDYAKAMQDTHYPPKSTLNYLFGSRAPVSVKEALGRSPIIQPFDQEWVDINSKWLEDVLKYGPEPYAKGGFVVRKPHRSLSVRGGC